MHRISELGFAEAGGEEESETVSTKAKGKVTEGSAKPSEAPHSQ